jgi:hypothetical protein
MSDTTIRKRVIRLAGAVGTLGALWFAAAAPFFQGGALHR